MHKDRIGCNTRAGAKHVRLSRIASRDLLCRKQYPPPPPLPLLLFFVSDLSLRFLDRQKLTGVSNQIAESNCARLIARYMGTRYKRAYHSYRDSVNSYNLQSAENRRTSAAQTAGSSASEEAQGAVHYGRRKRTVRKADANKKTQCNRKRNNKCIFDIQDR